MRIRLANAPVSWGVMEVEGWSPPLEPEAFLDELKAAAYEGTELGPYGYLPVDAGALRAALESRSLALTSAFVPIRLKERDAGLELVRRVAGLLGALGAGHLVLADTLWPERERIAGRVGDKSPGLTESEWGTAAENIRAAAGAAAGFGLRAVFHHHAGTYVETPEEIERLLEATGIGLCLDTGHYVYGGGDPVEAVGRLGRRVEYLHLKDVDGRRLEAARREGLGFLDGVRAGVFCPLGRGAVRFEELLGELEKIDYGGWAVVEQDVDTANPEAPSPAESARASREYLRGVLAHGAVPSRVE